MLSVCVDSYRRYALSVPPPNILDLPPLVRPRQPYGPAPGQFVELYRASPSSGPMVVAFHGGYWRAAYDLGHLSHACAALAEAGMSTASVEYRRLGDPGGGWPGTFEDVERALDALPALGVSLDADPSRVVLVGHSAGGQLALWAAAQARRPSGGRIRGVVALAPVSDLAEASRRNLSDGVVRQLLGGSPEEVPARYREASPLERVPLGVRTVLVHGTADTDVPPDLCPAYVERARAAGDDARLVTLEGADHLDLIDPRSKFWPQVVEAIRSLG